MNNEKKKGILLIVIGICIPLFVLPFVSGFDLDKGFMDNYYNTGIRIMKDTGQTPEAKPAAVSKNPLDPRKMRIEKIPFRFFLAPTVLLIYIGIVLLERARAKRKGQRPE